MKDIEDLYFAIGSLRYTVGYIISLTKEDKNDVLDPLMERKSITPAINYKGDILVEGVGNVMVNIAKSCNPVKGDEIIGYITKGQGITIHKKSCENIKDKTDRLIEVSWNMDSNNVYYTNIYVYTNSVENILAELITEIGKKDSSVKSCNTFNNDLGYIYELNIKVKDINNLENICNMLLKVDHVIDVTKKREF